MMHIRFMLLMLAIALLPVMAVAQDALAPDEAPAAEGEAAPAPEDAVPAKAEINPSAMPSLLFTYWEHGALLDAKRARGTARVPTAAELRAGIPGMQEGYVPPPEDRELRLGGIVYKSDKDWTIWLNDKRVTPDALPPDAIELRVGKEYIDIKWFDTYTNQIFPVRLRPHQRFNFDTRIFLPG